MRFRHTSLSIHNLSKNGKQSMANANQAIQIIFNEEIYNFIELKTHYQNVDINSKPKLIQR